MIPLAGKFARFQSSISGQVVNHQFKNWSLPIEVDLIPTDGFEKAPQADDNYYKSAIAGLAGGTVPVRGTWDNNQEPTESFWPGDEIGVDSEAGETTGDFLYLYLSAPLAIGFKIGGIVKKVSPSTDVTQAGQFEMEFFVETLDVF